MRACVILGNGGGLHENPRIQSAVAGCAQARNRAAAQEKEASVFELRLCVLCVRVCVLLFFGVGRCGRTCPVRRDFFAELERALVLEESV